MELVEIKGNEIYCDSHVLARKLKQKHAEVVRRIKKLNKDLLKLRVVSNHPCESTEEREYRGQKYTSYLMRREYFSLLMMRFTGDLALEWQVKFNNAFYLMEKQLIKFKSNSNNQQFLGKRVQSKIARKEETDVIKEFVEYATNQGSKSAFRYYGNITKATYKALGLIVQKKPKLRDSLDMYEISELILAERIATLSLKKYMDLGREYHDIYNSVRDDLLAFGACLRPEQLKIS